MNVRVDASRKFAPQRFDVEGPDSSKNRSALPLAAIQAGPLQTEARHLFGFLAQRA